MARAELMAVTATPVTRRPRQHHRRFDQAFTVRVSFTTQPLKQWTVRFALDDKVKKHFDAGVKPLTRRAGRMARAELMAVTATPVTRRPRQHHRDANRR
jgi:uncharacterized SAM-binding protein YcdF (DUF218 family)